MKILARNGSVLAVWATLAGAALACGGDVDPGPEPGGGMRDGGPRGPGAPAATSRDGAAASAPPTPSVPTPNAPAGGTSPPPVVDGGGPPPAAVAPPPPKPSEGGAAGRTFNDPYTPQNGDPGVNVVRYSLDLTFSSAAALTARARLEVEPVVSLTELALDLRALKVTSVLIDGGAVASRQPAGSNKLFITPTAALAPGKKHLIDIEYAGNPQSLTPAASSALKNGWMVDGNQGGAHLFGQPQGAAALFPANDHPADKALFDFRVTVTKPLSAVANGIRQEIIDNGTTRTFVYSQKSPMAPYLAVVAVGAQEMKTESPSSSGVILRNYIHPATSSNILNALSVTPSALAHFEERFGPYPFEAYGVVVVNQRLPAWLETQTVSIFGTQNVTAAVVAHELAHQWWGNAVTCRSWKDLWLNEGFATYAEAMWSASQPGAASLNAKAKTWQSSNYGPPANPKINGLFDRSVYYRGALALHALRLEVGDDRFFEILRTWATRYRYGSGSTSDFMDLAEELAVGKSTRPLLQAFLYDQKAPTLSLLTAGPADEANAPETMDGAESCAGAKRGQP